MGVTKKFEFHNQELHCEQVALSSLAERFGTPLYVYSAQSIIDNCGEIEKAFGGTEHLTTYAVKANSNVHLLEVIAKQGLGADVGSAGELSLARRAGFHPSVISFSGVGKRDDEIEYALREDILAFNVESEEEIGVINRIAGRMNRKARILLRLNLDIDAGTHAYISTSKKQNKFGVSSHHAVRVLKHAASLPNLDVRGIHSHIGSQITNLHAFVAAAEALASLVDDLRASHVPVHDVDFGGGFGVQYRGFIDHPQLPKEEPEAGTSNAADFIAAVLPVLKRTGCRIAIQPGRSIIAHAGVLLTKVLFRKETEERTFVIVDGGMNDLIRPSLYQAYHQIVPAQLKNSPHEVADVVGPCCESGDFFALGRTIPQCTRGDLLALMCTGAYGFVLSSNYNARLRPAEVLVHGDSAMCIRERETLDAFV